MNRTERLSRKLTRSARLLSLWSEHIARSNDKVLSLAELKAWAQTTFGTATPLDNEQPWLTFSATRFLETYLKPDMHVFEWGSGGSTCFYSRRVARVCSIEHDEAWFQRVQAHLAREGISNVELRCAPADLENGTAIPQEYWSSVGRFFRAYAHAIDRYEDATFDLVVVDGRARRACTRRALSKVKVGGVLLLDNSEREDVVPAFSLFEAALWTRMDFDGPGPSSIWPAFWRTTAFVRRGGK